MKFSGAFFGKMNWRVSDRRLRLSLLPQPLRRYAAQTLGVALAACLIILLFGLNLYPFESTINLPEDLSPIHASLSIPLSLILIFLIGFGLVSGALIYGSYQPGWHLPFLTRLIIGLLATTASITFLDDSITLSQTWNGQGLIQILLLAQLFFVSLAVFFGIAVLISAFISTPRLVRWATRSATVSYLLLALAFLLYKLVSDFLVRQELFVFEKNSIIFLPITKLITFSTAIVWIVGVISFWQVLTEAKIFSRDIGRKIADVNVRFPWVLAILFVIKGIWLLIGYWRTASGKAGEMWEASYQDGWLAWLLATLFAIATVWWLTHWKKQIDSSQLTKGALLLTGGLLTLFIVAYFVFILATLFQSLGLTNAALFIGEFAVKLADKGLIWSFLFTSILIPLSVVLLRSRKFRYLAPIFLLTGLWSLPFLLNQIVVDRNISFVYLTFDVMLTLTLLSFTIYSWRNKQLRALSWRVTLILVVSTLVAFFETFIPPNQAYLGFALLLILPMLYQLFFDSEELNASARSEGHRVIRTIGSQSLLMLVVAWAVVLGLISPNQLQFEDLATRVFLPPFLGLFLISTISDQENVLSMKSTSPVIVPQQDGFAGDDTL